MSEPLSADVIDSLMAQPSADAQIAWLGQHNLLTDDGLRRLLTSSHTQFQHRLDEAAQLLTLCNRAASQQDMPFVAHQATYLQAQAAAMRGDPNLALTLIEQAKAGFETADLAEEAWRTTVGMMHALGELGRYEVAIRQSDDTLAQIAAADTDHRQLEVMLYANRGICHVLMGRFDAAFADYDQITARQDVLDDRRMAELAHNRGIALFHLGRMTEAIASLETAVSTWQTLNEPIHAATSQSTIAAAQLRMGDYATVIDTLLASRIQFEAAGAQREALITSVDLAIALLTLNRLTEAREAFLGVIPALRETGMMQHLGRALRGLGNAHARLDDRDAAATSLTEAITIFEMQDSRHQHVDTLLDYAALSAEPDAIQTALTLAEAHPLPLQQTLGRLQWFDYLIANDQLEAARQTFAAIDADWRDIAPFRYRIDYRQGQLHGRDGDRNAAEQAYLSAIDTIEQMRTTLYEDQIRAAFLTDKVDVYTVLIELYLEAGTPDDLEKAFMVAERAKARTLHELVLSSVDKQMEEAGSAEHRTRLSELQRDLNAAYNLLLADSEDDRGIRPQIRSRAIDLEREIKQIRLENAPVVTPFAPLDHSFDLYRRELSSQLPIIDYHMLGDELMAFLFVDGKLHVIRDIATADQVQLLHNKLQGQWNRLRVGRTFTDRHLAQLEQSANRALHLIYQMLFKPLESLLPHTGRLVIVPHGVLHQLPFHALFDGDDHLVARYEITYAPSVAVYHVCANAPRPPLDQVVMFGVSDPTLVGVSAELDHLQQQIPAANVYAESAATQAQFFGEAITADVLHIATHGIFRAENPGFSAFRLHDGWVTADEIARLGRTPPLVTFNTCESGRSKVLNGDEILGLVRAFLAAGTQTLLVSQWQVQDAMAAEMMPRWYQDFVNGTTPMTALRNVQLQLKQAYPHPYYWAAHMLVCGW